MFETTIPLPWFDIIVLLVVGILELIFTIYLFVRYESSATITAFGFFSLCVTGWVLTNGIGLFLERGSIYEELIYRLAFIFILFLFPTLYLFIQLFPFQEDKINLRYILLLYFPSILFSLLIYGSKNLVIDFEFSKYAYTVFGSDYWIYGINIFIFYLLVIFYTAKRISRINGYRKWQLKMIYYSILISGIFGFIFYLILPYIFNIKTGAILGPGTTIIWLGFMSYIILKKY